MKNAIFYTIECTDSSGRSFIVYNFVDPRRGSSYKVVFKGALRKRLTLSFIDTESFMHLLFYHTNKTTEEEILYEYSRYQPKILRKSIII